MRKKNILLVSTNADRAGAPIHLLTLANNLNYSSNNYRFVFGERGPVVESVNDLGFETNVISMSSDMSVLRTFQAIRGLRKQLVTENIDIVHSHSAKAGFVTRMAAVGLQCKTIHTIHGWPFGSGRPLLQTLACWTLEFISSFWTDHFLAVSHADYRVGVKARIFRGNTRVSVIWNGISDDEKAWAPPKKFDVIMVARFCDQKDYGTLFRSLSGLEEYKVVCVGQGTESTNFRDLVRSESGVSALDSIRGIGATKNVTRWLRRAKVFVLTSHYEGLPLAIIEAMSQGLPIIATNVGGVNEIVLDGENGFLLAEGDHEGLKRCIKALITDIDLRQKFALKSRAFYKNELSDEQMAKKIVAIYDVV